MFKELGTARNSAAVVPRTPAGVEYSPAMEYVSVVVVVYQFTIINEMVSLARLELFCRARRTLC